MKTKRLLFFLFFVVGCQGGQNPLHEYPDYIQNATLPENIPQKPLREPVSSEFARIITNDPWAIVVGQEFAMEIDAYLFLEDDMYQDFRVELTTPPPDGESYLLEEIIEDRDYNYEEVEGEEENNGEVLKQKEYLFKWTPSQSILEEDIRKVYYLTFTLITDGEVALVRNKTIPVFISRRFEVPKITRVKLPGTMKEGETGEMIVLVEVSDSSETHSPTLQFESPSIKTHSDLRSYINFVEKKWLENGKWEFKYFIDFPKGIDVSTSHKKHSLRVMAISSFGIQSEFKNVQTTVNNVVQDPVVVGPSDATILEGGRTNVFISAFDSMLSGEELSARLVTPIISLPGEVFLSYLPMSGGGLEISINWVLPEGVENLKDSYRVEIEVENEGREGMRAVRRKKRHFVNIHVEKPPVPVEEEITSEETLEEIEGDEDSEVLTETSANPEEMNVDEDSQSSNVSSTEKDEGSVESNPDTSVSDDITSEETGESHSSVPSSVEQDNEAPISTEPSETAVETTEDDTETVPEEKVSEDKSDPSSPTVSTEQNNDLSSLTTEDEALPESKISEDKPSSDVQPPNTSVEKNNDLPPVTSETQKPVVVEDSEGKEEDKSSNDTPASELTVVKKVESNGTVVPEEINKNETSENTKEVSPSSDESQKDENDKPSESTVPEGNESESQNEDLTTPPLSAVRIMPFYDLKERGLS